MKKCSVASCPNPARTRGWCHTHYARWRKYGDAEAPVRPYRSSADERLRRHLIPTESGCLEFAGGKDDSGYGTFKVAGKTRKAHRVAYETWKGPIPAGMYVCHSCDNPPCCNPDHLFLGSQTDNMADMVGKGRSSTAPKSWGAKHSAALSQAAATRRSARAVAAGYPPDYKRCPSCGIFKPLTDYTKHTSRPDGVQVYCHECQTAKRRRRHGSS